MTNGHVESLDHIEVVKRICLHSGELFKARETGVQLSRRQENRYSCEFLRKMILYTNILLMCSRINKD